MLQKLQKINWQRIPTWIWIILPSLLFWMAWFPKPFTPLLFVSFIPLLVLVQRYRNEKRYKYYGSLYLALLGWNITTTWWVYYASSYGVIFMLTLNALFMLLPFLVYRMVSKKLTLPWAFAVFVISWIFYEYGHHRWDLSWPWLCLGNGFSGWLSFVQWYEWTGTLGGSVLVLYMNWWLYNGLNNRPDSEVNVPQKQKKIWKFSLNTQLFWAILVFCGMYGLSIVLKYRVNIKEGQPLKVAVLQPSFDPWNEKFVRPPQSMEEEMIDLSMEGIDSTVEWLLWPETSLVDGINLKFVESDYQVDRLRLSYVLSEKPYMQSKYPAEKVKRWGKRLQLLTGVNAVNYYISDSKPTKTARRLKFEPKGWYDHYNSAMWMDSGIKPRFYHKSKLVPGTEQMPFIQYLPFLESLALQLDENSTTGSLAKNDSVDVLGRGEKVAPIICYESIYGDLVRQFVNKGAGWIGVVTNDAWWRETAGYQQHYSYSRLRAIETRKWVARSANTGTSAFIDPCGDEYQHSEWFKKTCLQQTIYSNHRTTLYAILGDWGVIFLLMTVITSLTYWSEKQFFKR